MNGAVNAMTTIRNPTTPPATAIGLRRVKAASSRQTESAGVGATPGSVVTAWASPFTSGIPDARVEPGVAQVDRDVDEDEDRRVEQDEVLHHDDVALDHRHHE